MGEIERGRMPVRDGESGSLTLEATVVFPFFLALMLLLVCFVKVAMVYLAMDHAVGETVKLIAAPGIPAGSLVFRYFNG